MHHRRPNGAWFSEADEYAVRRAQAGPPGREALERNAPNLLADYLYLWEITVVRQAVERLLSRQAEIRRVTDTSSVNLSRRRAQIPTGAECDAVFARLFGCHAAVAKGMR